MKRKIIATTFTALSLLVFSGCSSKEVTIENKQPEKYEVLGKATGTADGSLGILGTAYYFIPMGLNSRSERAYENALKSVPGATSLINVTYSEDWYWWIIGTAKSVTVTGDAIREIK
jgi:hypothetical protein